MTTTGVQVTSTGGGTSGLIVGARWWRPLQHIDGEDGGWRVCTDSFVPGLNDIGKGEPWLSLENGVICKRFALYFRRNCGSTRSYPPPSNTLLGFSVCAMCLVRAFVREYSCFFCLLNLVAPVCE